MHLDLSAPDGGAQVMREIWQRLYRLSAGKISRYEADLLHDFDYLVGTVRDQLRGTPMGAVIRVYWSCGECGTHIGFERVWIGVDSYRAYDHYQIVFTRASVEPEFYVDIDECPIGARGAPISEQRA